MLQNLFQYWTGLGRSARIAVAAGAVAIVALTIGSAWWLLHEPYEVLFADLDPHDEAAIVAELDRLKLPYQIADDGKTLLVERDQVHKTRLKVMAKGVDLKGTVGFEIFNNADFGMTEFAQKINYQRALQGELARTIMSIEEVKSARVHLVMPESTLFRKAGSRPKASVALSLRAGHTLTNEQTQGIQRLVAAAVPEIEPNAVTVSDQQGVTLSRIVGDDVDAELSGGKLEIKKQTEHYLTRKVVEVLDRAVGPGQAIVSVDATLSWDQIKVTREDLIPTERKDGDVAGVLVKRRQTSSMAGVDTGGDAKTAADGVAHVTRSLPLTSEAEYEHGKKLEQIISTPGTIKRLSVGVMLPSLEPLQLQKVSDIIAMVVGLNTQRGDAISVQTLPTLSDSGKLANRGESALASGSGAGDAEGSTVAAAGRSADRVSAWRFPWGIAGIAIFLAFLVAVLVVRTARRPRLSALEREATFIQLQGWLQQKELPQAAVAEL